VLSLFLSRAVATMVLISVLNDALKSITNAERRGKRQVRARAPCMAPRAPRRPVVNY
jgi:hypothetical protein